MLNINRLKLVYIFAWIIFFNNCALANVFKIPNAEKSSVTTAQKYRDKNENIISTGMLDAEVIKVWGKPNRIYKLDTKNEYNNYFDEFWIYSNKESINDAISYELYFIQGKLIKIIELVWKEKYVNILK